MCFGRVVVAVGGSVVVWGSWTRAKVGQVALSLCFSCFWTFHLA